MHDGVSHALHFLKSVGYVHHWNARIPQACKVGQNFRLASFIE
jgi:hypothetical protein